MTPLHWIVFYLVCSCLNLLGSGWLLDSSGTFWDFFIEYDSVSDLLDLNKPGCFSSSKIDFVQIWMNMFEFVQLTSYAQILCLLPFQSTTRGTLAYPIQSTKWWWPKNEDDWKDDQANTHNCPMCSTEAYLCM